ncbi:Hypothetical protein LUCI_0836 [Lucifera butyrica]|uniref:Uncharacterized protein n=1 Tax=Lucifera butyrica TaxID=1351585 RepID=A0A498QZJ5_9FIRM|nr:hypothetical protein [Lucifera butyrica]VBB05626.1 Hypothetical protein LUCI_0836 [Lucifera butyrica]
MKITVNRAQFLELASAISPGHDISLMAADGILSVTSFTAGVNSKMVCYCVQSGQAFLTSEQWKQIIKEIKDSKKLVVNITIG